MQSFNLFDGMSAGGGTAVAEPGPGTGPAGGGATPQPEPQAVPAAGPAAPPAGGNQPPAAAPAGPKPAGRTVLGSLAGKPGAAPQGGPPKADGDVAALQAEVTKLRQWYTDSKTLIEDLKAGRYQPAPAAGTVKPAGPALLPQFDIGIDPSQDPEGYMREYVRLNIEHYGAQKAREIAQAVVKEQQDQVEATQAQEREAYTAWQNQVAALDALERDKTIGATARELQPTMEKIVEAFPELRQIKDAGRFANAVYLLSFAAAMHANPEFVRGQVEGYGADIERNKGLVQGANAGGGSGAGGGGGPAHNAFAGAPGNQTPGDAARDGVIDGIRSVGSKYRASFLG